MPPNVRELKDWENIHISNLESYLNSFNKGAELEIVYDRIGPASHGYYYYEVLKYTGVTRSGDVTSFQGEFRLSQFMSGQWIDLGTTDHLILRDAAYECYVNFLWTNEINLLNRTIRQA